MPHEIDVSCGLGLRQPRGSSGVRQGATCLQRGGLGICQVEQDVHVGGQRGEVGGDEPHRVVDFVGNARRQLTHSGHFFGLQQLLLGLLQP